MSYDSDQGFTNTPRLILLLPLLLLLISSCSSLPPDELFFDDVRRMVLLDREMGFREEVTKIEVVDHTKYQNQVEVQIRLTGWASHQDLTIGATLPVTRGQRASWATWKYFCRKQGKIWIIDQKYKVEEGFL